MYIMYVYVYMYLCCMYDVYFVRIKISHIKLYDISLPKHDIYILLKIIIWRATVIINS